MKKLLYIITFLFFVSTVISSCTEEVVKPKGTTNGTGSGVVE